MRYMVLLIAVLAASPTFAQTKAPPRAAVTPASEDTARSYQRAQDERDERILDTSRRATGSMCTGCGVDPSLTTSKGAPKPTNRLR